MTMTRGLSCIVLVLVLRVQFAAPFSSVNAAGKGGGGPSLLGDNTDCDEQKEAAIVIQQQLGYLPPNFLSVSARNEAGSPIAIKTYPLDGGARRRQAKAARSMMSESSSTFVGTPFPTLYWLTCPAISKAVAEMERTGYVGILEDRLKADPAATKDLYCCHCEYARERWECLSLQDRDKLTAADSSSSIQRMRGMLESSGIAGTNTTLLDDDAGTAGGFVPSVKCLHAHYADFRSRSGPGRTENPVGRMIHELLGERFPLITL